MANVLVPTPAYARLAAHYVGLHRTSATAPTRNRTGSWRTCAGPLNPILPSPLWTEAKIAAGRNDVALDLDTANRGARRWCVEVNSHRHSDTLCV